MVTKNFIAGSITAMITPFHQGQVDWQSFENFIEWQISQGSHGLVPCGTTGESPSLTFEEALRIIELTVATVKGRVKVIAGTGTNYTNSTLELTKAAQKKKVDGVLIVTPYYNRPTQDGLFAHYKTIHDQTDVPIILYNVPGRTAVDMSVDTVCRLAELPRIMGLKDAVSDLSRVTLIRQRVKDDFALLSGEDALAGGYLAQGGSGCISVTSNIAPHLCALMQNMWQAQDLATFHDLQSALMPLHKALFVETSPAPVKYAASLLGLCRNELRLPLLPASVSTQELLRPILNDLQLYPENIRVLHA
jgi:4-hydroxy-tetrahydrodipicolinate synthase